MTPDKQTQQTLAELWELPLELLAEMHDERVIGVLLLHARQSPPPLRAQALRLLGTMGNPNAIAPLVDLLPELDEPLLWEAAKAILQIVAIQKTGHPRHFDLDTPRSLLVEVVAELETQRFPTLPLLLACLTSASAYVIDTAGRLLSNHADLTIVDLEPLLLDANSLTRSEVVSLLAKFPFEQVRPFYLAALQDQSNRVRMFAIHPLLRHVSGANLPEFLDILKNRSTIVRLEFVRRLTQIEGEVAIKGLKLALEDSDSPLQCAALIGLTKLGVHLPAKTVLMMLQSKDGDVFAWLCDGLAKMQDKRFIRNLISIVDEPNLERSTRAIWLLGQVKAKKAVPALIKLLSNDTEYRFDLDEPPKRVSQYAVEALKLIGTPKALRALEKYAKPK